MTIIAYEDQKINDFLEVAQEVGITKAMRELGYPKSWATAARWAKLRGVEVAIDVVKQKATMTREFYKDEEILTIAQEALGRIHEELTTNEDLTADDLKKLSEAFQKNFNVWAAVTGKASSIQENRNINSLDTQPHLQRLLEQEVKRNIELENRTIDVEILSNDTEHSEGTNADEIIKESIEGVSGE